MMILQVFKFVFYKHFGVELSQSIRSIFFFGNFIIKIPPNTLNIFRHLHVACVINKELPAFLQALKIQHNSCFRFHLIIEYSAVYLIVVLLLPLCLFLTRRSSKSLPPAENKFVYTSDGTALVNHQPVSIRRICGEKNLFEISHDDHKRVREALMTFLKLEALKQFVGRMDAEIRMHLKKHWEGKQEIVVCDSYAC